MQVRASSSRARHARQIPPQRRLICSLAYPLQRTLTEHQDAGAGARRAHISGASTPQDQRQLTEDLAGRKCRHHTPAALDCDPPALHDEKRASAVSLRDDQMPWQAINQVGVVQQFGDALGDMPSLSAPWIAESVCT